MKFLLYLSVFIETIILSTLLVPATLRLARKMRIVDKPGERKVHDSPKPLLGGVAIFWSFTGVILLNLAGYYFLSQSGWVKQHLPLLAGYYGFLKSASWRLFVILIGGLGIHLLGLVDDLFKGKLTYRSKFPVQIGIVLGVALLGVRVEFMPGKILDILVTVFWIVGITNSFNLLDNMDGLTAGVAIISAGIFFVLAVMQGQIFFALLLAALGGACLGFLFYNYSPSKLFLGDGGSLFIGYLFGTFTVTGSYVVRDSHSLLPVLIPVLVLSIPLYDTLSVMIIRWRERRPLFEGDKRHFSHRLVDLGMSHRASVSFIYLVSLSVGMMALLLPYVALPASLLILFQAVLIYVLITILILTGKQNRAESRLPK